MCFKLQTNFFAQNFSIVRRLCEESTKGMNMAISG